jgi:hypothetical protein
MVAAERQGSYAELSRLRLAMPPPSKSGSLARTCGNGGLSPQLPSHRGASKAYRRGRIMIDRGIPTLNGPDRAAFLTNGNWETGPILVRSISTIKMQTAPPR